MKGLVKLPAFYLCLVLFAVVLVLFEDRHENLLEWTRPSGGGSFRLPKIQSSITFNISGSGHTIDDTSDLPTMTEPPHISQTTLAETTVVTQRQAEARQDEEQPPLKTILVWTFAYGPKTMSFGEGQAPFKKAGCEVDTCQLTGNRTLLPLSSYDAIIFHFRTMKPSELPATRSPHQRWVFWEVESASYVYQDPNIYSNLFNWTMTYRLDSDIPRRYGRVYPITSSSSSSTSSNSSFSSSSSSNSSSFSSNSSYSPALPHGSQERNYARGKTKLIAWFVSNCFTRSRREKIVHYMRKYIKVDVYGKCGKLVCPREKTVECYNMLGQHYKFYLSFENSLCKDYVTEKLFSVLRYDVVPVVFGLANYTAIAPPHSVINVIDFPTVKHLVDYLKYLDSNDTAYNEYFKWKRQYYIEENWNNNAEGFCELCKKLHQDHTTKIYSHMRDWFVKQGSCKKLDLHVPG